RGGAGKRGSATVNLRDVARVAEVSVATVSLVLNGSERISRGTADRVRAVMNQLGYRPNRLAQSLSGKYVKVLGAVLPDLRNAFADAYFGQLLAGVTDAAQERGFKMLLEQAKTEWIDAGTHMELFERRFVDGVLLFGHTDESVYAADFCREKFPALAVDNRLDCPQCEHIDYVASDYRKGAEQVMNYLAQLGHRHIGLLEAAPQIATVRDKRQAWENKLRELGVEPSASRVRDGHFTEMGGADACRDLMQAHPETTAILAMSDKMAIGAMSYLQRQDLKVPGDVSVVGFDDLPHAAFVQPALTTIHLPLYDVGRRACIRLIERVEGKRDHVRESLDTHLVIRDSTSIARRA
ncbi:MAG: LacI family DNA-binding transcriptional regulator, partial [Planctomycetota bacterium]